jgi:hypothetical protein
MKINPRNDNNLADDNPKMVMKFQDKIEIWMKERQ